CRWGAAHSHRRRRFSLITHDRGLGSRRAVPQSLRWWRPAGHASAKRANTACSWRSIQLPENRVCLTLYDMGTTTLTIRTTEPLRQALTERAAAENRTVSEVVREILEAALIERPLSERV